jgi:hypothetical protein
VLCRAGTRDAPNLFCVCVINVCMCVYVVEVLCRAGTREAPNLCACVLCVWIMCVVVW